MNRREILQRGHDRAQQRLNIYETGGSTSGGYRRRISFGILALILVSAALAAVGGYYAWTRFVGGRDADDGLARAAQRYAQAVALVVVEPKANAEPVPIATAWALASNRFATCAHVSEKVEEALESGSRVYLAVNGLHDRRLYVRRAGVHPRYGRQLGTAGSDVEFAYDVGLLETDDKVAVWFPVAGADALGRLGPGCRVASLGYPMERLVKGGVDMRNPVAVMQSGIVTAVSDFRLADAGPAGNLLVRHNLGSTGGSSGSPLFNAHGEVVGIVNAANMTRQVTGIDGDGKAVVTRTPSAAMVNFAQRADTLGEVAWCDGRPRTRTLSPRTTDAGPLAAEFAAEDASPVCAATSDTNAVYAAPPVAENSLLAADGGNQEVVKETYPNGAKKRVQIVSPSGGVVQLNTFHDNGQLEVASPQRAGKSHGVELEYTRAGRLYRRTPFEDGKRHGIEEVYSVSMGFIDRKTVYQNDVETEPTVYYDQYGAPQQGTMRYFFLNAEGTGTSTNQYEICPLVNGRRNGTSKSWYRSGAVRAVQEYRDGWLEGPSVTYYEKNGKENIRCTYRHGKLEGDRTVFWDDGKVKERGTWQAGHLVGVYTCYKPDGSVEKTYDYGAAATTAVER